MSNNLAGLNTFLATKLRDASYATWATGEMDNLITWAVADLAATHPRAIDPDAAASEITLVANTYFYALPTGMYEVYEVDLYTGTDEYGPLSGEAWQVVGDTYAGSGAKLRISPSIADSYDGYILRVHGAGVYDTTTNLIDDRLVPLVLAMAAAEAGRREVSKRMQSETWLAREQTQNISINELIEMVNEADREVGRLTSRQVRRRRPVPGRQG